MSLLSKVVKTAPALPSRIYLYATEKWGKSSWACYAPDPIFIMTQGETGLISLIESAQVPETAHFPDDCQTWYDLISQAAAIRDEPHDHKTLVIDTSNGAERLLAAHVLAHEFRGEMAGKNGFSSFGKGIDACIPHWTGFLQILDEIRHRRRMEIILLAHSRIKSVNNPEGDDYDQLRPEGIDKLWTLTHKWADIIACGTYELQIKDDKVKGSGRNRIIRCANVAAAVAGNRYGMPDTIACGSTAADAWRNFSTTLEKCKKSKAASLSTARENLVKWFKAVGLKWGDPAIMPKLSERIGRTIPSDATIDVLTADEISKLIARCKEIHEAKKANGGNQPANPPAAAKPNNPPPAPTNKSPEAKPPTAVAQPESASHQDQASSPATSDSAAPEFNDSDEPAAQADIEEPTADPKASEETTRQIFDVMKRLSLTWPNVRKQFHEAAKFAADTSMDQMLQSQADALLKLLQAEAAKKRNAA